MGRQVWLCVVPLRNRVDLDRVHRQIATSGEFEDVRPHGSGGGPFKENPWGHMNPYQSAFKWRSQPFMCGITDEGKHMPSSSGARLYLRGPDKLVEECFKDDAFNGRVEVADFTKRLFLEMQGSWLKRSSLQWHADRSTCSDDARGPVEKTRELPDG